jgi:hypothetical protein
VVTTGTPFHIPNKNYWTQPSDFGSLQNTHWKVSLFLLAIVTLCNLYASYATGTSCLRRQELRHVIRQLHIVLSRQGRRILHCTADSCFYKAMKQYAIVRLVLVLVLVLVGG